MGPLQAACLTINVIGGLQGVTPLLLGDSQNWMRLLLLEIVLEAWFQSKAILLISKGGNA